MEINELLKKKWELLFLGTVIMIGIVYYFNKTEVKITPLGVKFYGKEKEPIGQLYSIVEYAGKKVEGVYYISFFIVAKNTGEIPLTLTLEEANPKQLQEAFQGRTTPSELEPGGTVRWDSDLIPIEQFENKTVTFSVIVRGEGTYAGEKKVFRREGTITMSVYPDPTVGFEIEFGVPEEASQGETTTTSMSCWDKGTPCDPLDHFCCNDCIAVKTLVKKQCDDYNSITGCSCYGTIYRCTKIEFNCEEECEIYRVEKKVGPDTWEPIVPELVKTCKTGTCSYITTVADGFQGYEIETAHECS